VISVAGLYIYPIKSCRGIAVQAVRLDDLGPQLDRRFMLVDDEATFISQRGEPRLALVNVALHPTALLVSAKGMRPFKLPLTVPEGAPVFEAQVWKYRGPVIDAGSEAAEWFSEWLGRSCRLVRCPPSRLRQVNPEYSPEEAYVAFADGYPELLLSEASVADLGQRAKQVFPVDRFRPNIVVTGCEPYAEDHWKRIRIGQIELDLVKPSGRCVITTIDQATGEAGTEPLATLAKYRRQDKLVMFGQNCVHRSNGLLRVGDQVEIVSP
jgi:uncharacterized protein YcbX